RYLEQPRQEIDRHEVERVHEDDPEEDRESKRGHKAARCLAWNNGFGFVLHHADQHFHGHLETTRNTGSDCAGCAPQEKDDYEAHNNGPKQRVVVDDAEVGDGFLLIAETIQMNQVMLNVLRLRRIIASCSHLNPYPVSL